MRKVKLWYPIAAVLLGLSVSVLASYPAIKSIKAERAETKADIIRLDKALRAALVKNDIEAIKDLLSDDFELYTINHGVFDKKKWIDEISSGRMNYMQFSNNRDTALQGKQISNVVEITGNFWGYQADHYPVEMSIRAIELKNGKQLIKCITLKDVS